jgi:hypothetical protein
VNGVNIAQVMAVSERRHASMPAELAGCIVLTAADALASTPVEIAPHHLMLFDDGNVRTCGGAPCDEETAERALRQLLDRLLVSACSVTPALLRAARRSSQGRVAAVVRELEIALIPTNRGAAKRALARLCREVSRALDADATFRQAASSNVSPEQAESDAPARPNIEDIRIVVTVSEPNEDWIDTTPSGTHPHGASNEGIDTIQAAGPTVLLDIPDLEVPNGGRVLDELTPSNWSTAGCTQHPACSDVVELAAEDVLYIDDCDSIVNSLVETTDDETTRIATTCNALSSTEEHLTAEPFPLLVTSTASGARAPSDLGRSRSLDTMRVTEVPALGGQGEFDETILDAVTCVDATPYRSLSVAIESFGQLGQNLSDDCTDELAQCDSLSASADDSPAECETIVQTPVEGRHRFVAPARFARKPSMVSEKLAQFRLVDSAGADELVDRLSEMAELTQASTLNLPRNPAPPMIGSKNERPETEHEGPLAISSGHLDATGSV